VRNNEPWDYKSPLRPRTTISTYIHHQRCVRNHIRTISVAIPPNIYNAVLLGFSPLVGWSDILIARSN
jgi:hypothetical protein